MVTLELDSKQAAVVRALTGNIIGDSDDTWRKHSTGVFFQLGTGFDYDLYDTVANDVRRGSKTNMGIEASRIEPDKVFEVEDVLQAISRAVNDYGEGWVDPYAGKGTSGGCMNNYTDKDGKQRHCLAGYVFQDLIEPAEAQGSARAVCTGGGQFDGRFTEQAVDLLQWAQELQDRGAPWGAVLHAVRNR